MNRSETKWAARAGEVCFNAYASLTRSETCDPLRGLTACGLDFCNIRRGVLVR
jgi:hypothetical protein